MGSRLQLFFGFLRLSIYGPLWASGTLLFVVALLKLVANL